MCERRNAWIDFDADFAIRREVETFARKFEEIFDLFGGKVGRRATAPVKLHHGSVFRNAAADALGFALQYIEIRRRDALVFLNHYVTSAKQAQALTEGNMHVKRNRCFRAFGLFENVFQIRGAERVVPNGRRGIARVSRSGAIVLCKKLFADAKLVAHLLKCGIGERHRDGLLTGSAPQGASPAAAPARFPQKVAHSPRAYWAVCHAQD